MRTLLERNLRVTPGRAKKVIEDALIKAQEKYNTEGGGPDETFYEKLTAKTVHFEDPSLGKPIATCVFVTIHGYKLGAGVAPELEQLAKDNGFRVNFKNGKA